MPRGIGGGPWGIFGLASGGTLISPMECYPGAPIGGGWANTSGGSTDWASVVYTNGDTVGQIRASSTALNISGIDLSSTMNVYGVKWEANKIAFYFNGIEYYSITTAINTPLTPYLTLQFGSASGDPTASTFNSGINVDSSYEIEYMKVYRFA